MLISNDFEVAEPVDKVWQFFGDIPRVAACLPGAELTENLGEDKYGGRVAVRMGPVKLQFAGTADITERDEAAKRIVVHATGAEERGRGQASMVVSATLAAAGRGTKVAVTQDLQLAGAAAQYGRGMISDVTAVLMRDFSANLATQIARAERGEAVIASDFARRAASMVQEHGLSTTPASALVFAVAAAAAMREGRVDHAKTAALQYRHENKIGFVLSEQEKFKDQLEQATEKARLFEYCIQENKIKEQYDLSDKTHPENLYGGKNSNLRKRDLSLGGILTTNLSQSLKSGLNCPGSSLYLKWRSFRRLTRIVFNLERILNIQMKTSGCGSSQAINTRTITFPGL